LALFTERGYVATTVDHIAERAGVSKPTVFTSVGSKATIIRELRARALAGSGDVEGPPEAQAWWREAIDAPDPVHAVKLWARNMAEVAERLWPIYNPLRAAAGTHAVVR
jgi:AcrR family transcriptional regulator